MLLIHCPYCKEDRPEIEFANAGEAHIVRPKNIASLGAEEFEAFRGTLGISVHQCRPRDPEAKGLVERANGYLETSFLPGRTFTGPATSTPSSPSG